MRPGRQRPERIAALLLLALGPPALLAAACHDGEGGPAAPESGQASTAEPSTDGPAAAPSESLPRAARGPYTPRFLARAELPVPGKPVGVLAGDLDGDGHGDLAAAILDPGRLLVWRGDAHGLPREFEALEIGGYPLPPVRTGAPGGARVAVASRAAEILTWLDLARPGGAPVVAPLGARPRALGAGDLLADGSPEVVVALDGGALSVHGLAGELSRVPHGGARPVLVHVLGDGGGAVIGDQLGRSLALVLAAELAPGGSGAAARAFELGGIPRAAAEIDLDGDGALDLAVAGGERELWVLGTGAGGALSARLVDPSLAPRRLAAPGRVPLDLEALDLDGAAPDELVALHYGDSSYGVTSGGTVLTEAAGQTPVDLALGDLDGDGKPDLAIANRDALRISLLSGRGQVRAGQPAFYEALRAEVGHTPISLAAGDLDGDPHPDAAVLCAGSPVELVVLRGDAGGILRPTGPRVALDRSPDHLALADLDGDGARDLVWSHELAGAARLASRRGDGRGGLLPARPSDSRDLCRSAADLLAVDLDRDGRAEVAVADAAAGEVLVVPGHAGGISAAEPRRFPTGPRPAALAALDLGGDARLELAVALADVEAVARVLLLFPAGDAPGAPPDSPWRGRRLATAPLPGAPGGGVPRALAAGDLDGDGQDDLALLVHAGHNDPSGYVHVLLRRGDEFEARPPLAAGLQPTALALADASGDGRSEIFAVCQNSHHVNWWLATEAPGAVRFVRRPDLGVGYGPVDLALADLSGNGAPDLVTVNGFSRDVSMVFNVPVDAGRDRNGSAESGR